MPAISIIIALHQVDCGTICFDGGKDQAVVKPGRVLYEMEGVGESVAVEAFRLAGHKLPFSTRFVSRRTLL